MSGCDTVKNCNEIQIGKYKKSVINVQDNWSGGIISHLLCKGSKAESITAGHLNTCAKQRQIKLSGKWQK